jgi:Leucine-rich repeat (LRR) protein/predicted DNA-binding WGR domain protein
MPRYELVDASSKKFWDITLAGTSFTTTYGRIGTVGQSTTRSFDSVEQAKSAYAKLIAAKEKAGYLLCKRPAVEPAGERATAKPKATARASSNPKPRVVSFEEADKLFEGALLSGFEDEVGDVLLFDGDVVVDGDFLPTLTNGWGLEEGSFNMVAVRGDLTVKGDIHLDDDPYLYVTGTTRAESLVGGNAWIRLHDAEFKYAVIGFYNDGSLHAKKVVTPWVVSFDHDLELEAEDAYWVHDDGHGDFFGDDIPRCFVKGVLDSDGEDLDRQKFLQYLKAGKPVLKPNAKTRSEQAQALLGKAIAKKSAELDLSDKPLTSFPREVCAMTWLRKLVMDGLPIKSVPRAIGHLVALEELSLRDCELRELPEEIDGLRRLRKLCVADNRPWDHWDDETNVGTFTVPVRLPASLGNLTSLEELDVSELSAGKNPYVLPASAASLTKLRRIVADGTDLLVPEAMHGHPSIEEVSLCDRPGGLHEKFPSWVTTLPNLKVLHLRDNVFTEIPASLAGLTRLEELDLEGSLGCLEAPLPDLSPLVRLRVLRFGGLAGRHCTVAPKHKLLAQLFRMRLSALEELSIDRWDAEDEAPKRRAFATADLKGIGAWKSLRRIDLDCNETTELPDELLSLPKLVEVSLDWNRIAKRERTRLQKTYPHITFDFGD